MARRSRGRREPGSGSVFKRADGRWVAQVLLDYKDGKARYKTSYARSEKEAVAKLNQAIAAVATGRHVPTQRVTVAQFVEEWLEQTVKPHRAPKTYRSYRQLYEHHLKDSLGRLDLKKLTHMHVQRLINEKDKAGYAPNTVDRIRATLRSALAIAWKQGLVAENVAQRVSVPKKVKKDPTFLQPEEAKRLIEAAGQTRFGNLIELALHTGMRIGEVTGLRWSDVDFDNAILRVRVQLQRVESKLVLRELKSASSRRSLPLTARALDALKREKAEQLLMRSVLGERFANPMDLVFLNAEGRPMDQKHVHKHLKSALSGAGLPDVSFHSLRHTAASLMVAAGVPLQVVKDQLGHSSILLTSGTYAHMVPAAQREGAERLSRLLGG
ncbi:MAG: site-specific integrase [Nitrospirae bacterium]|nr:site-specific integrase [Fimbriimonadaceae bacterium]